jgi:preprotein translocase subunit YajC
MTSTFLAFLAAEAATETAAATGTGTNPADGGGGGLGSASTLIMMVAVFGVLYFLLIHPQRKKEKDRQRKREEMLKNLTKSDHVLTIGGIHGIVASVTDTEVVLKVDEKSDTRIRVIREAISKVVTEDGKEVGEMIGDKDKK